MIDTLGLLLAVVISVASVQDRDAAMGIVDQAMAKAPTTLHVTLNALATPRRSPALASLCKHLNATETTYPGTNLTLHYGVNPHPTLA